VRKQSGNEDNSDRRQTKRHYGAIEKISAKNQIIVEADPSTAEQGREQRTAEGGVGPEEILEQVEG
jgi:hypothetical protein